MASSLLDPVAQHAADVVQARGLGVPDRNALMAGVLSQRTPKSGLFSKDFKAKERDLRVFLFDCAIVLLTPNPNEKEKGWVLFCDPIPIELLTIRAVRTPPNTPHVPQARRRSWFLDRLPAAPPSPARAKTPPPLGSEDSRTSTPPSAFANGNGAGNGAEASDFSLVISSLGRKPSSRTWPLTLLAANATEQRAWTQCVSSRQEEIRLHGRDGSMRGWGLAPIRVGVLGVTCYVDYDVGYAKARLWGTPDGLYEHILSAPNQQTAVRKILDLPGVTHVLVMDFDERLMIVLVAEQTAYLAPFPGPDAMLDVSRLKKLGTNITHIAAGVLVSQPTPPPIVASSSPSAFIGPDEKRERRKSATLTKPPPRAAVVSGASSIESEVPSMARKDKDRESAHTTPTPATPTVPSVVASAAPAESPAAATTSATAAPVTPTTAAPPATLAPATPRETLSPTKTKEKEKKTRRLSDIGIFLLWKRKPEKDKTKKEKIRASTADVGPSAPGDRKASLASIQPKKNQAASAKTESAISSLKASPVEYDGPALTKSRSVTLPAPLMRLPSFEFDRSEPDREKEANVNEAPKANGNGHSHEPTKPASIHEPPTVDEVGALANSGRPSTQTQTMPSRMSMGPGGFRGLTRKRTADSNKSAASKPKELGPPPKLLVALDFPSIAWPSVLDGASASGSGDKFAQSDFLADVQKDIGELMAGSLGMSLVEEKTEGNETMLGRSRSPVPGVIAEESEGTKTPQPLEVKESGGEVKESAEPLSASPLESTAGTQSATLAPPPTSPVPAHILQAPPAPQSHSSHRSSQPQHTRFLVLSKSTTLSTNVKLYTVGGLKVEDDGDIGGGRLTFYKECYIPSQTFSIDFLKSRICFASTDGFEIMDPTIGKVEQFLDPVEMSDSDGPLGFLIKHPRRPKASAVFRVDQKFLCCYDEFAFFLDKFGKRAREDWLVKWLGTPTSFSVQYPYLFAFEPEFTEIRHCATGELLQLIPQPNTKRLTAGDFIAPAQKFDGVPNRRVNGELLLESEGSLYALRPLQQ